MDKQTFIELVKTALFLGEARQKTLIENAPWMTSNERAFLAERINATGRKIDENNAKLMKDLETIETALKDFKKKDLPKILKQEEEEERKTEETEEEELLKKL